MTVAASVVLTAFNLFALWTSKEDPVTLTLSATGAAEVRQLLDTIARTRCCTYAIGNGVICPRCVERVHEQAEALHPLFGSARLDLTAPAEAPCASDDREPGVRSDR